jgi:hypothetical protein
MGKGTGKGTFTDQKPPNSSLETTRESDCVARVAAMLCGLLLAGCGSASAALAERSAARELSCPAPRLRVQATGELAVGVPPALRVSLYDAEGCARELRYLCVEQPQVRCTIRIEALPEAAHHRALARALHLLRTSARARCPGSELRVVQESETLFRFHACDGAWLYHCRARGCERL